MDRTESCVCATLSVALLLAVQPSHAQEAPARIDREATSADEIIVTAQRRNERLQDVPIAITAVTAEALESGGVQTTRDLATVVPGLNFTMVGTFVTPSLRGISSSGTGLGADTAVPIYLDGVLQDNAIAGVFDLADISDIQVLKGPQGTLYGRNATGGAILIGTRKPTFEPTGRVSASYGSFDEFRAGGFVSSALVGDVLAASISGNYARRDGYVRDLLRGGRIGAMKSYAVRGKLLLAPAPDVRFTLSGMYGHMSDLSNYAGIPAGGNSLSKRVNPALPIATAPYTNRTDREQALESTMKSISLTGEIDTGVGRITSISAYQKLSGFVIQDADAGPAPGLVFQLDQPTRTYSQEVSIATNTFGIFSFIAGASYFDQRGKADLYVNETTHIFATLHTEAFAGYGEVTLTPADRLSLIGGVRYSWEKRGTTGGTGTPTLFFLDREKSWSDLTPRLTAKYELTEELNIYATYNEAFKSGTYAATSLNGIAVDPETVSAVEVGLKFKSGHAAVNLSAYSYDYKDIQVSSIQGTSSVVQNAAAARSKGFDIDGSLEIVSGFQLNASMSYIDAKYTRFPTAVVNVPTAAANCPAGTYPCGNVAATVDATGNPLPRAPKFTGSVTLAYSGNLLGGEINPSITYYHNSGFSWEAGNRLRQAPYDILSVNIAWRPANSALEISIYGRNLTDKTYAVMQQDSPGGDLIAFAQPRSIGARVGMAF